MRAINIIRSLILLLAIAISLPCNLSAKIENRIVATVNSDIITLHELNTSIRRLTGIGAADLKKRDEKRFYQVHSAVLDNLINERLTEQQIVALGITVTEKEVAEAIEKVKRENHLTQEELDQSLGWEGITLEGYKQKIKKEIERFRLVNYEVKSKIVITEEDIKSFYRQHIKDYRVDYRVKLARIFLKVENPDDDTEIDRVNELGGSIVHMLDRGSDFPEMARTYSQCPSGPEGGSLGWIKYNQLDPGLRNKIDQLAPGEHTELTSAPSGFQIIRLLEEKKGGTRPFEEVRDSIYSTLFKKRVEERYSAWLKKLRKESFIKVIF